MKQTEINSEPEVLERNPSDETLAYSSDNAEGSETLVARIRLLWSRRGFLLRLTAWAAALAIVVAFVLPKHYEATARLMPPDNQAASSLAVMAALSNRVGSFGALAGDLLGLKTSGALFVGVLRSQTVQDRLVEQFDLKRVYGERLDQDARKELANKTLISEDRKSGIVTISVTDKDPIRAAAMGNAYTEELNRLVAELSTSAARRERTFIEERLKAVQGELDEAAKKFSEFASKNVAIDIKEQGKAMVEAAARLQGELIAAESELEGLRQIYTDNNVRVRAVRARIGELRSQLEKLGGDDPFAVSPAEGQTKAAGKQSLYPSIRRLPVLGVTYAQLYRDTKVQETVFELLTQQYELAKVQEAREIPTVKVLDVAQVPEKKSFPPRLLIIFLVTLLTFVAACVWVLASATWEEIDPEDPGKNLAREVYGDVRASVQALTGNGHGPASVVRGVWSRIARRGEDLDGRR